MQLDRCRSAGWGGAVAANDTARRGADGWFVLPAFRRRLFFVRFARVVVGFGSREPGPAPPRVFFLVLSFSFSCSSFFVLVSAGFVQPAIRKLLLTPLRTGCNTSSCEEKDNED